MISKSAILIFSALFVVASASLRCDDDGFDRSSHDSHDRDDSGDRSERKRCSSGWTLFNRPTGKWCMRIFPLTGITRPDAESTCNEYGAYLSGVQNSRETEWIHRTAARTLPVDTGSVWIGAERTSSCLYQKLSATCTSKNAFRWTDHSATGTDGFTWIDGSQPDNALGGNQNCLVMFYAPRVTIVNNGQWNPGVMDDVNCDDINSGSPRLIQGYVCGKKAR